MSRRMLFVLLVNLQNQNRFTFTKDEDGDVNPCISLHLNFIDIPYLNIMTTSGDKTVKDIPSTKID